MRARSSSIPRASHTARGLAGVPPDERRGRQSDPPVNRIGGHGRPHRRSGAGDTPRLLSSGWTYGKWNKGLPPYGDNPFRVGLARFELAASSSRTKRATKLRHSPMLLLRNRTLLYDVWSTMTIRRRVAYDRLRGSFREAHCFRYFRSLFHGSFRMSWHARVRSGRPGGGV